ncbi:hypothetical protein HJG53_00830 [Sphingomonas sp. ID1715]|uniref:hypothetical protein n=1 Tax=Sphingomonas sp. ID1715 TaxID=1656898 RepID=UPI001488B40F|nr:hypothetical protein [Sphingomonas sp. ID1715]NNM75454.1 hypothetical protein [Sphingomonas sp. ID1715]
MAGEALRFDYHRSVAPMMWVLVALSSLELLVLHFLLALWKPWVAAIVSLLTLAGMAWMVRLILSFRRLPVMIEGAMLVMRVGTLRELRIPIEVIARLRDAWTRDQLKQRDVANLALIAYPNVWIDLMEPVTGRKGLVTAVAHRLDDPAAFRAALAAQSQSTAK